MAPLKAPATAGAARKPRLSREIVLITAGFSPVGALHVYRAYYGFLYDHILNELQEFVVDPEENEVLLRLGQGLTILLSGLESQLSLQHTPAGN